MKKELREEIQQSQENVAKNERNTQIRNAVIASSIATAAAVSAYFGARYIKNLYDEKDFSETLEDVQNRPPVNNIKGLWNKIIKRTA